MSCANTINMINMTSIFCVVMFFPSAIYFYYYMDFVYTFMLDKLLAMWKCINTKTKTRTTMMSRNYLIIIY